MRSQLHICSHLNPMPPQIIKNLTSQIASLVVDMFVVDQKRNKDVELSIRSMKTQEQVQQPDVYVLNHLPIMDS